MPRSCEHRWPPIGCHGRGTAPGRGLRNEDLDAGDAAVRAVETRRARRVGNNVEYPGPNGAGSPGRATMFVEGLGRMTLEY